MSTDFVRRGWATRGAILALGVVLGSLGGCRSTDDEPPGTTLPALPTLPTIPATECQIDLTQWGIYADATHAPETTEGINAAIASAVAQGCGHLHLPAGDYLIGKPLDSYTTDGIHLLSNMALELDGGATLQMVTNNTPCYCTIDIDGIHDVELSGGTIRGDRATHSYDNPDAPDAPTHEFGYLFCIRGNSDIAFVHDVAMADATGDGVCIEATGAGASCSNVTIAHTTIANSRRQGISVVGGTSVLIEDNEIHHINGTAPQFGIDIESENHVSRDVIIRNNSFHDNAGGDFVACDGTNLLFEGNSCVQAGGTGQTDGPVVYWTASQPTIRSNTISMETGSSNGRIGIIAYHLGTKPTAAPTVVDGNVLDNCGIDVTDDAHVAVTNNQVHGMFLWVENLADLSLTGNVVESADLGFVLRNVTGSASGNTFNGAPIEFPLSSDQPYSN